MKKTLIISGISNDTSGTGRLIQHLESSNKFDFYFPNNLKHWKEKIKAIQFYSLLFDLFSTVKYKILKKIYHKTIIIHPQTLGGFKTIYFIKKHKNVWIYLVDSSFFCLKSYNYIENESGPCLRCINNLKQSEINNCIAEPKWDNSDAIHFLEVIKTLVNNGHISVYTQTETQKKIIQNHFNGNAKIEVVGLITSDIKFNDEPEPTLKSKPNNYIVFHGTNHAAKGYFWMIEIAKLMPDEIFYFPCKKPNNIDISENCIFEDITWETGLKDTIINSKLTIVPSLWSATIEGALIKSLIYASNVAVVENFSAFSSEIPKSEILVLPFEVKKAADKIRIYLENEGNDKKQKKWFSDFKNQNDELFKKLLNDN
jgi:hypothetical protein